MYIESPETPVNRLFLRTFQKPPSFLISGLLLSLYVFLFPFIGCFNFVIYQPIGVRCACTFFAEVFLQFTLPLDVRGMPWDIQGRGASCMHGLSLSLRVLTVHTRHRPSYTRRTHSTRPNRVQLNFQSSFLLLRGPGINPYLVDSDSCTPIQLPTIASVRLTLQTRVRNASHTPTPLHYTDIYLYTSER